LALQTGAHDTGSSASAKAGANEDLGVDAGADSLPAITAVLLPIRASRSGLFLFLDLAPQSLRPDDLWQLGRLEERNWRDLTPNGEHRVEILYRIHQLSGSEHFTVRAKCLSPNEYSTTSVEIPSKAHILLWFSRAAAKRGNSVTTTLSLLYPS